MKKIIPYCGSGVKRAHQTKIFSRSKGLHCFAMQTFGTDENLINYLMRQPHECNAKGAFAPESYCANAHLIL